MSFLSTVISNMGNAIQKVYFERWGGAPTTTLIMPESEEMDRYTKQRYFKWLNSKIPDLNLLLDSDDKSDLQQKIRSATNFLREYTRDTKKYSAVYRDNVAYGFSRNLVAVRYIGITVSIISIMINVGAMFFSAGLWLHSETISAGEFGPVEIVALVVSVLSVALLVFVTNECFVKQRAFRYARSLYEVREMG